MTQRFPRRAAAPKPTGYVSFVEDARAFVESKGLSWSIKVDKHGSVTDERTWDMRKLTGSHARHAALLNAFSVAPEIQAAAVARGWSPATLPAAGALPAHARECIKAVVAVRCKEKRLDRSTRNFALVLRKFFSTTRNVPWEINSEDVERYLELEGRNTNIIDLVAVFTRIVNENLLSLHCPLVIERAEDVSPKLLKALTDRGGNEKLPERRPLYELIRIIFQEDPRGHQDRIRFAVLRLITFTGLRVMEVMMLPADCLRIETHLDVVTGRPAGEIGGVTTSVDLRYFAEKHEEFAPDLLVEEVQPVPERFQAAVIEAVQMAREATDRLRFVLRTQHSDPARYSGSDLRRFRTTTGREVTTADLLFLVLCGGRRELPDAIPPDAKVAPAAVGSLYQWLGKTILRRYSKDAEATRMVVRPHGLRHLMNTEFFRLNIPDTVITQHFGRQTVAQSYQYDHRSLAEKLRFVELPTAGKQAIEAGSPQELVARMVVAGLAPESHIAKSFKSIQASDGDEAAFRYLAANADGFHVTPYGFCTNSFSLNPCARHLKCFHRCKHYAPSGLTEHRVKLETLVFQLQAMRDSAASKPANALGRRNQIAHAESLLQGVKAALASPAGAPVFPEGADHSARGKDLFS